MLSTDPAKTKDVVFGYRPQAKDSDKLVDKTFLNDMMKSLGYASSLFEKRPDELFPKSLAELKVNFYLIFRASSYRKSSLSNLRMSLHRRPKRKMYHRNKLQNRLPHLLLLKRKKTCSIFYDNQRLLDKQFVLLYLHYFHILDF